MFTCMDPLARLTVHYRTSRVRQLLAAVHRKEEKSAGFIDMQYVTGLCHLGFIGTNQTLTFATEEYIYYLHQPTPGTEIEVPPFNTLKFTFLFTFRRSRNYPNFPAIAKWAISWVSLLLLECLRTLVHTNWVKIEFSKNKGGAASEITFTPILRVGFYITLQRKFALGDIS